MPKRYRTDRYTANILQWWHESTDAERAEGILWYAHASATAYLLATRLGRTLDLVVGVIAALSPQVRWERNIALAEELFTKGTASAAYGANIRKAERIIAGEDPDHVLRGPKVRAFYALILSGGTTPEVCIDSIAILAATGVDPNPLVSNADAAPVFNRPRQLSAIRSAYGKAASVLGVRPCAVQAVVWLAWRNARDAK